MRGFIFILLFACLGLGSSARGTIAPVAEKVFVVSTEQICVGNEQVTVTTYSSGVWSITWSDGQTSWYARDGGPGGAPDVSGMGESTDSTSTVINDDDSSFSVTVTTWKRPGEPMGDYHWRHVKDCWQWQDELGLPHAPRKFPGH